MIFQYKDAFISNELFVGCDLKGCYIDLYFVGGVTIYWDFQSEDEAKYIFEYLMGIIEVKENKKVLIDSILVEYKNKLDGR